MAYVIAKIAGKQFKVSEGDTVKIEKQSDLHVDVLAYCDGEKVLIGTPVVDEVKVKAVVEGEEMSKKVRVARFKSKSRYEKVKGHRQPLSIIKIEKISLGSEKAQKAEKPEEEEVKIKTAPKKKTVKSSAKKKEA